MLRSNEKNRFDKPLKTDTKTYDNIQKIATGQRNDAKNYYKTIAE